MKNSNNAICRKDFYSSRKSELLQRFDDVFEPGIGILTKSIPELKASEILKLVRMEYESIIPEIPYIGGNENPLTELLVWASQYLGFYKVLKERGLKVQEIGEITYEMTIVYLNAQPKLMMNVYGYFKYHTGRSKKMMKQSKISQKRQYPMDFVFTYLEGNGEDFDYGTDMIECSIIKFFRTQNAEDFVPYICILDFPISKTFSRGLLRTKTLAEDSNICDFRYKKGRNTKEILPPGFLDK